MTSFPQTMPEFKSSITPLIGTGMFSKAEDRILRERYIDGMTFDECAKRRMVTRERIRQIEAKALRKWRQHIATKQGVVPTMTTIELHRAIPALIRAGGKARISHRGKVIASVEVTNYTSAAVPQ